jgi:hypothetical protein
MQGVKKHTGLRVAFFGSHPRAAQLFLGSESTSARDVVLLFRTTDHRCNRLTVPIAAENEHCQHPHDNEAAVTSVLLPFPINTEHRRAGKSEHTMQKNDTSRTRQWHPLRGHFEFESPKKIKL